MPLIAIHGNPIGGPLSSINNDHVVGNDAMAMATMQGGDFAAVTVVVAVANDGAIL
jgi:hypothetical protein